MSRRIALIALPFAMLTGCVAGQGSSPSLAPRPIESRGDEIAAPAEPAPAVADPALAGRIADLAAQIRAGDTAFAALLPRATAAAEAARGAAMASEAWVSGQQLLTALEGARGPNMQALGALDSLLIERLAADPAPPPEALSAVHAEAARVAGDQQARIDALRGLLSR